MSLDYIKERREVIKNWVDLDNHIGLEIAPNWVPLLFKQETNVYYCDRMCYQELIEREKNNPDRIKYGLDIMPIDFVWEDNKPLVKCTNLKFDYIVHAHVLEHVPNFLGFLNQQREVLKDNGLIGLILPDPKRSGEYFRPLTTAAQIIEAFILNQNKPTPGQVYESLRHSLIVENEDDFIKKKHEDFKKSYTIQQCLEFARFSTQQYLDVHCWAFTPDSFTSVTDELKEVGLFDFDIKQIQSSNTGKEFFVKLVPNKSLKTHIKKPLIKRAFSKIKRVYEIL